MHRMVAGRLEARDPGQNAPPAKLEQLAKLLEMTSKELHKKLADEDKTFVYLKLAKQTYSWGTR